MSIDLKNANSKDYWKQVNKLFAICRKKKVNPNEIQLLASYPYIRNKQGQNLIMYALEKSPNMNVVNYLFNNGHNIIKDDIYDVFELITYKYKSYEDNIIFIIDFIIKNNAFIEKNVITMNIKRIINIKTSYKFVKYLIDNDVINYIDIYHKTTNVNIIKLFDDKFTKIKMNENNLCEYIFKNLNDDIIQNINDDYIKYLIDNSNIIEKQTLIDLLKFYCMHHEHGILTLRNIYHFKKLLNKIYSITKIDDTKYWKEFMDTVMLIKPNTINKQMFYFGLITGYIKDFPINIIKGFNICNVITKKQQKYTSIIYKTNDCELAYCRETEIIKQFSDKLIKKYNMHPLFLFSEDLKCLYQEIIYRNLRNQGIIIGKKISKEFCIKMKKDLLESLK